jgi:hypothetical protein
MGPLVAARELDRDGGALGQVAARLTRVQPAGWRMPLRDLGPSGRIQRADRAVRAGEERPGFVQQKSTATGADLGGLVRTLRDCDLHICTAVDVVPLNRMQEVWGSNPDSSTRRSSRFGEAYFHVCL